MFPGTYVPRCLCSPVPMFPGFCTLIVVISINRLQILPTRWYDSRLGLCLGFRFRVLVRVRVRLELQTVFPGNIVLTPFVWMGLSSMKQIKIRTADPLPSESLPYLVLCSLYVSRGRDYSINRFLHAEFALLCMQQWTLIRSEK